MIRSVALRLPEFRPMRGHLPVGQLPVVAMPVTVAPEARVAPVIAVTAMTVIAVTAAAIPLAMLIPDQAASVGWLVIAVRLYRERTAALRVLQ